MEALVILFRWAIRRSPRPVIAAEPLVELPNISSQSEQLQPLGLEIENYRPGYPRFAALIGAHDQFFTFRSFRRLRARLLLLKQDELVSLEGQLDRVDRDEASPVFLGKRRCDRNEARVSLVAQIQTGLAEYDLLVEKSRQVLGFPRASTRDVESLQNWVEQTACLSREETKYLDKELVSLACPHDGAMKEIEEFVEDHLVKYYRNFRERCGNDVSTNTNVYIYRGSLINVLAKGLMLSLITVLLLIPVILCIALEDVSARLCVIILSTAVYLTVLARLTKGKVMELILAGATFATILTAFISSNSG